ncbi:uncharacterized protein LOC121309988 isoform X3 [Polyodon spathula]|uniref:uncharacterized protein LOC121309988 isoform X3 n=1 Tax=Polyodon spathula TaxID=7913 RepID=UPI001B7E1632|nr:uncharacterized protein LOC121309988 isoform X3 [Polyodon spathula]
MRYITEGASLKEEEKKVKNKWRWAWLDEQDSAGRQFRGWCTKIDEAGVCYCIVCNKTIVYGGNGKKVLAKHANCDQKHAAKMREVIAGKLSVPHGVPEFQPPSEEEVTEAACSLICDWAEHILKRSFDTVVEIARFLIQEHIVNPRSSTAHTIMSASLAENPARPDKRPRIEEESSSAQRTRRKKPKADNMHFSSQRTQIPASLKTAARRQRNGTSQQNRGTACPSPLTLLPRQPAISIVTGNTPLTREPAAPVVMGNTPLMREPAAPVVTGNTPLAPQHDPLPAHSRASLPCSETAAGILHPPGACKAQSWTCEVGATQWRSGDPTEAGPEEPEQEWPASLPPPCGKDLSDIIKVIILDDRGAGALHPASEGNTEAALRETIDLTAESP